MSNCTDAERDALLDRLSAENDIQVAEWKEAHKNDPCERCGTNDGVTIIPNGSVARLTPLCATCQERLGAVTDAYHQGFDNGMLAFKRLPWRKRLFV